MILHKTSNCKDSFTFSCMKEMYLSSDLRQRMECWTSSDDCSAIKAFQYVKRLILLFRAVVKFFSSSRLFTRFL